VTAEERMRELAAEVCNARAALYRANDGQIKSTAEDEDIARALEMTARALRTLALEGEQGEPVAWRYRYNPHTEWRFADGPAPTPWPAGFEEEPLYRSQGEPATDQRGAAARELPAAKSARRDEGNPGSVGTPSLLTSAKQPEQPAPRHSRPEQELPASTVSAASVSALVDRASLGSKAFDVQQPAPAREPSTPKKLRRWKHRWGEDDLVTGGLGSEFYTVKETEYRKLEAELDRLRAENDALQKDAERWRYWRNYWPALCRFEVARFARIDLTRVHVDSPALMDQVTDAAMQAAAPLWVDNGQSQQPNTPGYDGVKKETT